ncbi:outer envelope protein [Diaphorobacter sp. HDW4A]|uniref:outer envelope protein n=1 Tax=Diaphorobacter sp. HDW4A TaxID=2714924 RepID=UPI00140B6041|nr:outer envelope protein [Diaphorobacter sp. HDW4A]QIL82250.1 outer envelope protein [Diaphorobacter sp. HDW4A]
MKRNFNIKHRTQIAMAMAMAFCFSTLSHAQEAQENHAPPTNWNDTFVGARYGTDFYFPGSDHKVAQKIGTLATVGGFKYGSYIFNVDYLVSDQYNPEANGTKGAQDVYSVGRVDWSAGKILGQQVGFGFVRDVGFTTGFEFGAKNDLYGSRARMLVLGPSVNFAVPRGYWNAMAGLRTESNHNGIAQVDITYKTAWHLESSWLTPFNVGSVPMVFKGFASVTGPKGKDGFHQQTKTEVLARASALFDVGALMGSPRTFYIGPAYEYWKNMYGTPPSEAAGTKRSAFMLVGEIHF